MDQAFLTLPFAPGQWAQVDGGSAGWLRVGASRRRLSFFVTGLGYSRRLDVEFPLAQNPRRLRLDLAPENQPHSGAEPFPPGLSPRPPQRDLSRWGRLGQKSSRLRPGPCRLSGWPLRPLHHRRGPPQPPPPLPAAPAACRLKAELKRFLSPHRLCVDKLGSRPIDKTGAALLFQVIRQRYEKGSLVHTPHQPFKHWPKVFKNASTLPSAVLDRLLHHAETVILEGQSYRMKDQIETPQLRGDHSGRLAPAGRPFSCPAQAAPR